MTIEIFEANIPRESYSIDQILYFFEQNKDCKSFTFPYSFIDPKSRAWHLTKTKTRVVILNPHYPENGFVGCSTEQLFNILTVSLEIIK